MITMMVKIKITIIMLMIKTVTTAMELDDDIKNIYILLLKIVKVRNF